ncbi:ASCH domain-containing protein [Paenarthrobacter sp. PH39-S1]|uniref:ASCH domain-containing protein n=1 Tax=Paenarthrobacter sp. PH39-S1 TaxID=3046204 RepID=UPI0024B8A6B8|nr:ASCH domain-containing protein [Paenarthrobacter sp. PH39-S1]MDJ0357768.1 ASCH domain-containing protein [Paenarthrobacter sp. PH39-S1]
MTAEHPPEDLQSLPVAEFAFPGPLRDKLVAAVLDGSKTSTTGLVADYEACGDPIPRVGDRSVVIDSEGRNVAILEVTGIVICPLDQVDLQHALDEGEGHASVLDWRKDHEEYWHSPAMREALKDPGFTVNEETLVVLERFRVVSVLTAGRGKMDG